MVHITIVSITKAMHIIQFFVDYTLFTRICIIHSMVHNLTINDSNKNWNKMANCKVEEARDRLSSRLKIQKKEGTILTNCSFSTFWIRLIDVKAWVRSFHKRYTLFKKSIFGGKNDIKSDECHFRPFQTFCSSFFNYITNLLTSLSWVNI